MIRAGISYHVTGTINAAPGAITTVVPDAFSVRRGYLSCATFIASLMGGRSPYLHHGPTPSEAPRRADHHVDRFRRIYCPSVRPVHPGFFRIP